MQSEDWLVDIETATDLTDESRTKLAQAKSKALTHTLITEAHASGKCWEEIKDLLSHRYWNHNCNKFTQKPFQITSQMPSQEHIMTPYSSTYHYCCDMPHQGSSSHNSSLTHSRDCSRSRSHTSYKPSKNTSSKSSSSSSRTTVKPQDKKQRRVMIDGPQSNYYSSDDTSSDSEDDLN